MKTVKVCTPNGMCIIIEKDSDPQNVQLFSKLKLEAYEKEETKSEEEDT